MSRPSEPLLRWLRQKLQDKGLNVARAAHVWGIPRADARKRLSGTEPMTIDQLLALSELLDLKPSDMGLPSDADVELPEVEVPEPPTPVPGLGTNQPEHLFRTAYTLGCDLLFVARADQLEGSGIPDHVIARHKANGVPIRLDAAFHAEQQPRYDEHGVTLRLVFDSVVDCTFPWTAIQQMVFFPEAPEAPAKAEEPETPPPGPPRLRLVK